MHAIMSTFTVSTIIDGDTFDVAGGWRWNGQSGTRIRPTGYDAPELGTPRGHAAKRKLEQLILHRQVEIPTAHSIDRGRLVCDVIFNGNNLADYFPEYKT